MKRMLALLFAVSICLLGGEIALRIFAPFPDYSFSTINSFPDTYHPLYGYAGRPDFSTWFILPDFRHRIINNSRGFRDRERSYEKGGKKRIVILGDSTAWGWGVEAEDRFSDIMERGLKGWEVINLAQAGYSTDQELLALREEGLKYRPDIVLLLFDRNDVVEGNNAKIIDGIQPKSFFVREGDRLVLKNVPVPFDGIYWGKKNALASLYGGQGRGSLSGNFLRRSHLYNWISFRISHPVWSRPTADGEKDLKRLDENMVLTRDILGQMNRICSENGARLVIADIPSEYSPLLKSFCEREGITYIDLAPSLQGRILPVVHRRVGHWNRYGHRLAARAIVDRLVKDKITAD